LKRFTDSECWWMGIFMYLLWYKTVQVGSKKQR
jgi:hypothetical protein